MSNHIKEVYLDHSATTPVDLEVLEAMYPFFAQNFGNASSVHQIGRATRIEIDKSREQIAKLINAFPDEIYFVSGGTEADNIAIKGIVYANIAKGDHIITSAAEHDAVLNTCRALEKQGVEVSYLPVDEFGQVSPKEIRSHIKGTTILISIIHCNNEVGTINPIEDIGQIAKEADIYFHSDAVQSFGKIPIDVLTSNLSLMSISGHKIYGPKGIGALYMRSGTKIDSLIHGGHQEKSLRPGTENNPCIVGLSKAATLMYERMENDYQKVGGLRDYFQGKLLNQFNNVKINGHPSNRLYNNLNVSFLGIDSETMLLKLDRFGIAASNGSACNSGSISPSHVLRAMGLSDAEMQSAIRFSLGRQNTKEEIDYVLDSLKQILS